MESGHTQGAVPHLGLWDAVSIILGIIIGVGIFETPAQVFQKSPGVWPALAAWLVGGFLCLVGALCFAEMAAAYPRSGGEYVYLTRGFGPQVGFLFAWAQLTVIRPAGLGAMAYVFAMYAADLAGWNTFAELLLALGSVLVLTLINLLGATFGKTTQNVLTVLKIAGLLAIVVFGLASRPDLVDWEGVGLRTAIGSWSGTQVESAWFAGVMILILWTYAGWHEAAYIAAEVKDGPRNIPRALIVGTLLVTGLYLLVNLAFWRGLGPEGVRQDAPAAQVIRNFWPHLGGEVLSVLVMVSALGALNGMIFTTARIYVEFGRDHRLFQPLSRWSRRLGTPARALGLQGAVAVCLILVIHVWGKGKATFEMLITVTAAVFWAFFLLTGLCLFLLRIKDPHTPRPFRVPGYPWLPLLFVAWCGYMIVGSVLYAPGLSCLGLAILAAGLPFYYLPEKKRRDRAREAAPQEVGPAAT